ncbi:hypothetical protein SD71_04950 [Cohnella kolymensis]|uniref:Aminoglycoside phosphotransferase domain-containing protein n=2 Tax=Cohnella kolymensis TaxID=1590652 RepID=A0ABR5A7P8_9BACL|nr:hypothetical protein SD71_04950 [Cohnella kolymensis]
MKLEEIIQELYAQKFVEDEHIELSPLSGGTVSQVYLVRKEGAPLQVLKANDPVSNEIEIRFLQQYADCSMLPRVLFRVTHLALKRNYGRHGVTSLTNS